MATAQQSPPDLSKDLVVERLEGENEGIVVFGINRPKAMNALSKNLVTEMEAAVNAVKFDKTVRVLVLRSHAKGAFCAGADLKERAKMTPDEVGPFVARGREIIGARVKLPMPEFFTGVTNPLGLQSTFSGSFSKMGLNTLFC